LTRRSSSGAEYAKPLIRLMPGSSTRGPMPQVNASSYSGTWITWSWRTCWIWKSSASRFFGSSSRAWRWKRSSTSGRTPAVVAPPRRHVRLEPRRRVARGARDADDHVLELLLAPRGRHGRALHRPDLGPDADGLQVRGERLSHREVRRPGIEVARVEPVR